jgi:hypothetical protein
MNEDYLTLACFGLNASAKLMRTIILSQKELETRFSTAVIVCDSGERRLREVDLVGRKPATGLRGSR